MRLENVGEELRVIWVEVPTRICFPSPLPNDKLLPKVKSPKVVVPKPPLLVLKTPATSAEPKMIEPLNNEPEADLTMPVPRLLKVLDPVILMVPAAITFPAGETENIVDPEEEATTNGLALPAVP